MTLREAMKNWIDARKAATEAGARLYEAEKALLAAWHVDGLPPPFDVSYAGSLQHPPVYNPPGSGFVAYGREDDTTPIVPRRTGCACPPGTTSAMCPHANCPWKPQ